MLGVLSEHWEQLCCKEEAAFQRVRDLLFESCILSNKRDQDTMYSTCTCI